MKRRNFLKYILGVTLFPMGAYTFDSSNDKSLELEFIYFSEPSGGIPNSRLPLALYHNVIPASLVDRAMYLEELYRKNQWYPAWRWQIYDFHHFHSTSHEVIGCFMGQAELRIGGKDGKLVKLQVGNVAIIPAGVGHKQESASKDFMLVGGYPVGYSPDICYDNILDLKQYQAKILKIPNPISDPITLNGGIVEKWKDL